jgi:hypothetical protein
MLESICSSWFLEKMAHVPYCGYLDRSISVNVSEMMVFDNEIFYKDSVFFQKKAFQGFGQVDWLSRM